MTFNPADYHPDWKSIVRQINEQAGNRCEWCGVDNGDKARSGATVVLTTAHACHDKRCIDPGHLFALCQRCHLNHDRDHHIEVQRRNRRLIRIAKGQGILLEVK